MRADASWWSSPDVSVMELWGIRALRRTERGDTQANACLFKSVICVF
jgi:hypothetical protein